jgi:hypothetical protein
VRCGFEELNTDFGRIRLPLCLSILRLRRVPVFAQLDHCQLIQTEHEGHLSARPRGVPFGCFLITGCSRACCRVPQHQNLLNAVTAAAVSASVARRTKLTGHFHDRLTRSPSFTFQTAPRLERINAFGNMRSYGLEASFGLTVNYKYLLGEVEQNHEQFVRKGKIRVSDDLVPEQTIFEAAWRGSSQINRIAWTNRCRVLVPAARSMKTVDKVMKFFLIAQSIGCENREATLKTSFAATQYIFLAGLIFHLIQPSMRGRHALCEAKCLS